jgi:hypothetical protein
MSSKKYYDYLKNYDAKFLNKYESWSHHSWGRRSNFMQLLYFRCYSLFTGRNILLPHLKLKSPYIWICVGVSMADVWGIWFYQEIYNKYYPWKWTYYQPYMRGDILFDE